LNQDINDFRQQHLKKPKEPTNQDWQDDDDITRQEDPVNVFANNLANDTVG